VDTQRATEIQVMLEGVPLPATRADLIRYAEQHGAALIRDLEELPDEKFEDLDAVGALLTMQPSAAVPAERMPRPESGKPPGGDDYLEPFPADTGKVRHDAPRTNPPQQAIEKASKTQQRQKAEQGGS
jgi:hypothetical protein